MKQISLRNDLHHLSSLLFFCLITLLALFPLIRQMSSALVGNPGDNLYYAWLIGWFQKAIFELHQNPLVVSIFNFPYGWNLAYSEITLVNVLPALPLDTLFGPIFAYNSILLLTFIFSGWITYEWVFGITHNFLASIISGLIFAFTPYRVAHAYGHLPLLGTQWLALHYAGLYFSLSRKPPKLRYAILAGVGFGLAALSSMYYLYMQLIVTPLMILVFFFLRRKEINWHKLRKPSSVYLTIIFLFLAFCILPYLQLAQSGEAVHHSLTIVDQYSASVTDFILPSPVNFLFGEWVQEKFGATDWIEHNINLGFTTFLLGFLAIFWHSSLPDRRFNRKKNIWWLAIMGISAMILAMGTTLHWRGAQVFIQVPSFLHSWIPQSSIPIPLPGYLLFRYLPFYDGMRAWARYGIFAALFFSVLAGIGATYILERLAKKHWQWIVSIVLMICISVEFYPSYQQFTYPTPSPIDARLSQLPGNGAVAVMPADQLTDVNSIFETLYYNKPFLGMFYGAYLPKDFEQVALPALQNFPDPRSVQYLQDRQVQYVIVQSSLYQDWKTTQDRIESLGLTNLGEVNGEYIFAFDGG
jgi:hypothetical protein